MRIVGIFLQSLAIGIILLHSFIPHSHHSELAESDHICQHTEASSILDLIALAFHVDHQDGQLEEFTASFDSHVDAADFVQCVAILHALYAPITKEQKVNLYSSLEASPLEDSYRKSIGLRGPPTLS